MKRYDLIVVGAGPSGLSAAIEAAKKGMRVIVFDENDRPGGQLFKQIHKFFGSKEHKAKVRGFKIGEELLEEAAKAGVEVSLNSTVVGMYQDKEITVRQGEEIFHYKGDAIIIATGAAENMVTFEGWTLPGVIGAGAAQTMMNLHGVKPGNKILMLGSGNVGLVVSFQLAQCGCSSGRCSTANRRLRCPCSKGCKNGSPVLSVTYHRESGRRRSCDRCYHRRGRQPFSVYSGNGKTFRCGYDLSGSWLISDVTVTENGGL